MSLSRIGQSVAESATLKLNMVAGNLKAKGEPVIHLGGGEPKGKAPMDALIGAAGVIGSGEVRYTPAAGIPALRDAIVGYTERFYDYGVKRENVIASGGAKQAIMVCLQAILDPADEVVFPCPYWVSYPEMVKLCGARPVAVRPADGTFYPRLSDIEKAVTPKTKAVIINSPNNPTGAMYSESFIADIVGFCEKKDLFLIMDDIYHRLIFDGLKPVSSFRFIGKEFDSSKLVVVNGVSKQYAMTGFRIGWAVGGVELIRAMTNIQAHQTSGPSVVLQHAALGALNSDQSQVDNLRETLDNNRKVMMEQLNTFDGIKASRPDGTFYCFIDFSKFDKDSTRLAHFLLEKVKVVTVPGVEFGTDGFLRLSTCGSIKDITQGIERIRWALDPGGSSELTIGDQKLIRDWK